MHRIYGAIIEIVAASVFLIPILGLYGKYIVRNTRRILAYIALGFYFVAVLSLVGFPNVIAINIDFTINIIPFIDMAADFVNACLNVLLFVPLGVFLPLLWDKYRDIKSTMLVICTCIIDIPCYKLCIHTSVTGHLWMNLFYHRYRVTAI
jgi:glycopeptide antibiotics resistance protein